MNKKNLYIKTTGYKAHFSYLSWAVFIDRFLWSSPLSGDSLKEKVNDISGGIHNNKN